MSTCSSRSMSNVTSSIKPFLSSQNNAILNFFNIFSYGTFLFVCFCLTLWLKPLNKYMVCAEHCDGSYKIIFKTLYTLGKSIIFILKIRKM